MPTPNDGRLRVFVGDVHGCASELEDLLTAIDYSAQHHALYFCGDVANRGPRSLDALRMVRDLDAEMVLGNHDLHLLAFAVGGREPKPRDTMEEIIEAPDADELLDWLRARPFIMEWPDLLLVHAALHPRWSSLSEANDRMRSNLRMEAPLADVEILFATTARYCDSRGERPPRDVAAVAKPPGAKGPGTPIHAPYRPWDDFWPGPRTVVFGHWARRGLVNRQFVRGLDTGCVWGGELTAWIAEEDRFVSVPARDQYLDFA